MWSEMSNTKEQDNLTVVTQPLPNDEPRDSQRALLVYIYVCVCVCVCVCVYLYLYLYLSLSIYFFSYCLKAFPYLN